MKTYSKHIVTIILLVFISCSGGSSSNDDEYLYPAPDEVNQFLEEINASYPGITSLVTIGKSESNRDIKALIISDNPADLEGEPSVRLTGGIHGNEKMGVEMMIRFIEYLTYNYGKISEVTDLVNSRYICIIPVLNPDGLASNSRYNSRGVDLNRNFNDAGDHWTAGAHNGTDHFSESETIALKTFSEEKNFTLSITYHTGAVLVNMPFDYGSEAAGVYPLENNLVKFYAKTYTNAGSFLSNPDLYISPYMSVDGTINGGDWYIITGSLQDWSYTSTGCLDYTIEISKNNPADEAGVQKVFLYNKASLMAYITKAGEGIYGQVTDSGGTPLPGIEISVSGGDITVKTDSNGYYHRILLPGTYNISFTDGVTTHTETGVSVISGSPVSLDVQL